MILSVLLTGFFTLGGALFSYYYDGDAPLLFRFCAGVVTGSALFGLAGFWLTLVLNFSPALVMLAGAVAAAPLVCWRHRWLRAQVQADARAAAATLGQFFLRPRLGQVVRLLIVGIVLVVLWLFFDRAMIVKPEGVFTGVTNNLGDLPFHLGVITSFTEGHNFPPQDPSYAGARFTYPLLADFVAAGFVRLGASYAGAMFLQNLTLAIGLVAILYRFTWKLTRDLVAATIAPLLLLFSGGFGWLMLFRRDAATGASLGDLLEKLPHDYSIMAGSTFRWGNALTALLVTQRSLLFGLPLTILVFTQWWRLIAPERKAEIAESAPTGNGKSAKRRREEKPEAKAVEPGPSAPTTAGWKAELRLLPAGLMAGALPLIHAHSFAVVIAAAAVLAVLFRSFWRTWAVFFAAAFLLAVPQLIWITHGGSVETQSFLGFHFGWDNGEPDSASLSGLIGTVLGHPSGWITFVIFWIKNTGIFIPLLLAATIWIWRRGEPQRRILWFYFPFLFFFIGPNLVKLAPWVWDNIKVLIYWYVASIPLVAGWLGNLWSRYPRARAGVGALVVVMILAGSLDVWRVISGATELQVFDSEAVALAEQIRQKTPASALMLNAPTYNTAVFLTGRRSYLGYTAHVWSHGIDYQPRYRIVTGIYAGGPDAKDLIAQNGINFIVVGPLERSLVKVNDGFLQQFPVVATVGNSKVYQVSPP